VGIGGWRPPSRQLTMSDEGGGSTSNFAMTFVDVLDHWYLVSCVQSDQPPRHQDTQPFAGLAGGSLQFETSCSSSFDCSDLSSIPQPTKLTALRTDSRGPKIPTLRLSGKLPIPRQLYWPCRLPAGVPKPVLGPVAPFKGSGVDVRQ
jgi:hypothetical protein